MSKDGQSVVYKDTASIRSAKEIRYVAECLSIEADFFSKSPYKNAGRRRKFSNPLFATPAGLLHAFPESIEHLFRDHEEAWAAIKKYGTEYCNWSVYSTTLEKELKSKRYLRWQSEVKSRPEGTEYKEPRRSLEESYAIYAKSGMEGLRAVYTRAHCFHLLTKFEEKGWDVKRTGSFFEYRPLK